MVTRPAHLRSVSLPRRGTFWVRRELGRDAIEQLLSAHRENAAHGRWLKNNRGTLVTVVSPSERRPASLPNGVSDLVVKQARLPWRRRLAHRFGAVSRFCGDFDRRERLSGLGIASPDVIAASHRPVGSEEYEVTVYVQGSKTLREYLWLGDAVLESGEERAELLSEVGAWLRRMHEAGLWQRDLKPNNILVRREPGSAGSFLLLDITAVRFLAGALDETRRTRNLAQLLDLPVALDGEATTALLSGYTREGDAGIERLEARVRRDIAERREQRRSRTGCLYVDEEYFRHGERP